MDISIEEDFNNWKKYVTDKVQEEFENMEFLWTNGKGENHSLVTYYNVGSWPLLFLVGKDGSIANSSMNTLNAYDSANEILDMLIGALEVTD